MARIIPVVLCGGTGSRLWPLSRPSKPKQFLKLYSSRSLVQETVLRAQRACGAANDECVFVALDSVKRHLEKQLCELGSGYDAHLLCEPSARNTAAAVAFAACYVEQTFGTDAVMWVLPADHYIREQNALNAALKCALTVAEKGALVTFGITPTKAETGYGYIRHKGTQMSEGVIKAATFVEKPDEQTARAYIESGEYLWNSGMFVFTARTAIESFERYAPEILVPLQGVTRNGQTAPRLALYKEIPKLPFEKVIMERAENIAVVPCNMGWSDIGSWGRLFENIHQRLFAKQAA